LTRHRKKKANLTISRLFNKWYYQGRTFDLAQFLHELQLRKDELRYMHHISQQEYSDTRSGAETYGFGNIEDDLAYISDRYNAAFRLRWLLDVIDRETQNLKDKHGNF